MKIQRWIQAHNNQITIGSGLLIVLALIMKFGFSWMLGYDLFMIIASIIAGVPIIIRAIEALKMKMISIELLVSIAVIGAFVIGEYNESAIVTFLFLFGSYLEQRTLEKTRGSIKALTEMAPTTAQLLQDDGSTEEVDVDDLDVGDVVLVKAGGQIPVDGQIVDGKGYVNEASVTGEAKLVTKQDQDKVFSGTMLDDGFLQVKATKVGDDTTFAKIIELVEDAQDTKSHAEKFIDKFSTYYTPAVLVLALLVFIVSRDFKLAITVLVLGCPGALVIGAPVSNVAGIGNGAKNGVLIKGGEVMDTFAKVDTLIFDKTGTLTKGHTEVSAVQAFGADENQMVALTAKVESLSDHPLGRAVVDYAMNQHLDFEQLAVGESKTIKGQGICAVVDDHDVVAGNALLMKNHNIDINQQQNMALSDLQKTGSSTIMVAVDGQLVGLLGIADVVRDDAKAKLAALKASGIKRLVMLTGDNEVTAQAVAARLGIDEVHANLMPEQKVEYVKALKEEGRTVAFIGDGINDSPSIATADIGISMGSGTDVAVETSDIVLMQSSFTELYHAYGLAKKTVLNTRENIVIAIGVVIFLLVGLIAGYIYMASGMFVHEASILVVIFNAMRLLRYVPKENRPNKEQKVQSTVKENVLNS